MFEYLALGLGLGVLFLLGLYLFFPTRNKGKSDRWLDRFMGVIMMAGSTGLSMVLIALVDNPNTRATLGWVAVLATLGLILLGAVVLFRTAGNNWLAMKSGVEINMFDLVGQILFGFGLVAWFLALVWSWIGAIAPH